MDVCGKGWLHPPAQLRGEDEGLVLIEHFEKAPAPLALGPTFDALTGGPVARRIV
ncbi:MAG TPA: hypothetical protein VMU55_02460 [Solirubrobacteraceae bacterium]|nr:hypothetical protein [Solirubrobacteraceae bacterium]